MTMVAMGRYLPPGVADAEDPPSDWFSCNTILGGFDASIESVFLPDLS